MTTINNLITNNQYQSYTLSNKQEITEPYSPNLKEEEAECEKEFTPETTVIKVTVNTEEESAKEYLINIKEVDTKNASRIEMFALCTYADACKNLSGNTTDSWNLLNSYITDNTSVSSYEQKQDWTAIVEKIKDEHMDAGRYKQVLDGNKLIAMFEKYGYEEVKMVKTRGEMWIPYKNIINTMDVDDGYANIEYWNSGELRYNNRLNEEASWTMDVTQEQLQKISELINVADEFREYMYDKSFWENYLNQDISIEELKEIADNSNRPKTYQDFINNFSNSIKNAWEKAKQEAGTDGFGMDEEGNIMYLTEFARMYVIAGIKAESTDLFGSSEESVLELAKEILERLNDKSQPEYNRDTQSFKDKEKVFYEKFIENMEIMMLDNPGTN